LRSFLRPDCPAAGIEALDVRDVLLTAFDDVGEAVRMAPEGEAVSMAPEGEAVSIAPEGAGVFRMAFDAVGETLIACDGEGVCRIAFEAVGEVRNACDGAGATASSAPSKASSSPARSSAGISSSSATAVLTPGGTATAVMVPGSGVVRGRGMSMPPGGGASLTMIAFVGTTTTLPHVGHSPALPIAVVGTLQTAPQGHLKWRRMQLPPGSCDQLVQLPDYLGTATTP
jgi:hypothetical protein